MPCFPLILALIAALYFVPVVQAQESVAPHGPAGTSTEAVGSPGPPEILNRVAPSLVQVLRAQTGTAEDSNGEGRGSGIAIPGGVISSDHVVGDADQVIVIASDGRRGSAKVVRRAPARDLVLLETNLKLPPVDLEAASDQQVGELLLVMGYPQPDILGDSVLTLTHGLASAIRRDQEGITYLQTDAAMDPGVSGGAVVNLRGHVVGVPSFGLQGDAGSGLNFAVGGEEIQALLQQQPIPPDIAGLVYAGDPHDLLPSDADIGPGWKVAPMTPETPTSSGSTPTARAATASVRLVSGDTVTLNGAFAELRPAVMLAQDAEHARWTWERAVRHPPAGFVRLSDPTLDATCRAYERIGADVTDVQVLCQEANVVVGVAVSGTPELALPDVALHAADLIRRRVRQSFDS
jgi:S1-C subfamily serine protease